MEFRTVPMRDARHNDALNVCHNVGPFLGLVGRLVGNQRPQVARLNGRQNTSVLAMDLNVY